MSSRSTFNTDYVYVLGDDHKYVEKSLTLKKVLYCPSSRKGVFDVYEYFGEPLKEGEEVHFEIVAE